MNDLTSHSRPIDVGPIVEVSGMSPATDREVDVSDGAAEEDSPSREGVFRLIDFVKGFGPKRPSRTYRKGKNSAKSPSR